MGIEKSRGFSFLGLVVALVFIGLLVGGSIFLTMLKRSSDAQHLVANIGKYNASVNTYKTVYRSIPGDSKNMLPSGDENGHLNDQLGTCDGKTGKYLNDEKTQFWAHLSQANVIGDEKYEAYSPEKCGGTHSNIWAAVENYGLLWPSIELDERAALFTGTPYSPIHVSNEKYSDDLFFKFKINATDAHKFEYKFMEEDSVVNSVKLINSDGVGNCRTGGVGLKGQQVESVLPCDDESAAYAEYTYYLKIDD